MNNSPFSNASSIPSVLASCEFVVLVPVPAVAVLNCWMLYRSALLHPNLKTILIVQSVAILFYAMQRLLSGLNLYKIAIAIADDTITFSNLIGHFLIIERTVATLWARDYAKWKSRWINLIWKLVVLIIVAFDLLYPTFNGGTANRIGATVIFTHIALLLSVAEIVAFSALHVHNQRSLGWANHPQQYNLGERYQVGAEVGRGNLTAF